jgi:alanine racemase
MPISYNLISSSWLSLKVKMMVMKRLLVTVMGLEIAKLLEHHKVDYLGVAFADEGSH